MKNNIITKTGISILALSAGLGVVAQAQNGPAPQIAVNGQVLRTESGAFTQNGRVLVPMRDIFESLGATVNYNDLSRQIAAQRGTTIVRMTLGSNQASVNNVPVMLDSAASSYGGRTYVPLRFVSEAMGATVNYNGTQQLVSITGQGYTGNGTVVAGNPGGGGSQVGGYSQISIPANTVVKVRIDQELTSATAYVGQPFSATVVSQQNGDSEFPAGTKIMGEVVAVTKKAGNNPGTLDLDWNRAVLPGNQNVALDGTLISLDNDSVQTVGGRIQAKGNGRSSSDTLKVVGIGAGAGFLLGRILKQNSTLTAVLGAAGGYLYDKSKNKGNVSDARVAAGTELGVRLRSGVSYRDTTGYSSARDNYLRL
ncbi:hypothetical protein IAD21_04267 [Abditibacteriota bacterium]|nr:hypothetical protein IAD21_04267 [Abditibacteriota bacterium]